MDFRRYKGEASPTLRLAVSCSVVWPYLSLVIVSTALAHVL